MVSTCYTRIGHHTDFVFDSDEFTMVVPGLVLAVSMMLPMVSLPRTYCFVYLSSFLVGVNVFVMCVITGPADLPVPAEIGATSSRQLLGAPWPHNDCPWPIILWYAGLTSFLIPGFFVWLHGLYGRHDRYYLSRDILPAPRWTLGLYDIFWSQGNYALAIGTIPLRLLGAIDRVLFAVFIPVSLSRLEIFPVNQTTIGQIDDFVSLLRYESVRGSQLAIEIGVPESYSSSQEENDLQLVQLLAQSHGVGQSGSSALSYRDSPFAMRWLIVRASCVCIGVVLLALASNLH